MSEPSGTPRTAALRSSTDPFVTSEAVEKCLAAYHTLERELATATAQIALLQKECLENNEAAQAWDNKTLHADLARANAGMVAALRAEVNEQCRLKHNCIGELERLRGDLTLAREERYEWERKWNQLGEQAFGVQQERNTAIHERDEARAELAQITPLKNSDIRLVIQLATDRDRLAAELATNWASDDTAIKALCAKHGIDTEGSSFGVPTMVECVEQLEAKLDQSKREAAALRGNYKFMLDRMEHMVQSFDTAPKDAGEYMAHLKFTLGTEMIPLLKECLPGLRDALSSAGQDFILRADYDKLEGEIKKWMDVSESNYRLAESHTIACDKLRTECAAFRVDHDRRGAMLEKCADSLSNVLSEWCGAKTSCQHGVENVAYANLTAVRAELKTQP